MKKERNIEVSVTIICAILIAITSIVSAFVARQKIIRYDYREVPNFDTIATTDYFPLAIGNYWTYEGTSRTVVSSGEIVESKVILEMSVKDAIKKGAIALYILSGNPSDAIKALIPKNIDKDTINVVPGRYGFLVVSNKIFQVEENELEELIGLLNTGDSIILNIVEQSDLKFEFPLFKGLKYGETAQITRSDLRYCWYVNDKSTFHTTYDGSVKTISEYQIIHNTMPDYEEINFSPYLGIISYKYIHHGSRAEVSVSLKEYDVGEN